MDVCLIALGFEHFKVVHQLCHFLRTSCSQLHLSSDSYNVIIRKFSLFYISSCEKHISSSVAILWQLLSIPAQFQLLASYWLTVSSIASTIVVLLLLQLLLLLTIVVLLLILLLSYYQYYWLLFFLCVKSLVLCITMHLYVLTCSMFAKQLLLFCQISQDLPKTCCPVFCHQLLLYVC